MSEQLAIDGVCPEVAVDSDVELTPPEVFEPVLSALRATSFSLDPCSHPLALVPAQHRIMPPADGLSLAWPDYGVGWLNPPYSAPYPWLLRAVQWASCGQEGWRSASSMMVALLKLDPTTSWWADFITAQADGFVLLRDRVRHVKPGRAKNEVAPFASALVVWGHDDDASQLLDSLEAPLGTAVHLR